MLESLEDRTVLSHFRYGTIDWTPVAGSPNTIQFHLTQAWREDYPWGSTPTVGSTVIPSQFSLGDNSYATISLIVKSVDTTSNYFVGEATFTHTYLTTGRFTAAMSSSARLSSLQNNHDGNFQTQTVVDVGGLGTNNPYPDNSSPVSSVAPITQVADNQIWTYQIPAVDPNGDTLHYRLATNAEAGYAGTGPGLGQPPGLSISPSGLISWNILDNGGLATSKGNLWTTQIMVEDLDPGGAVKSSIPVDMLLQITDPQHTAPTLTANPTGPFQPVAFTAQTFNLTATAQAGFTITDIHALNAPTGMTFSAFGSPASTKTITASWTPTQAQANSNYVVTFQTTDSFGATGTTSVTITPQAAHFPTSTSIAAPDITYGANGLVTVNMTSTGGTPTGTVNLSVDGGAPLAGTLDASGSVTFTLPGLTAGNHALSATYAANGNFLTSSAGGTIRVFAAPTAIQIQAQSITYNADGTANVTVTSAAGVPTGMVTLSIDGGPPLTQSLVNGSTVFVITAPVAGLRGLHASYAAQGNYAASTADATLQVNQAPTSITIDAPVLTYGDDGLVRLKVSAAPGVPTPTGGVTLTIGGAPLVGSLVDGEALFTIPAPSAGDYLLHAAFAQGGNYAGSTADGVLHVVAASTTVAVNVPAVTYNRDGTVTLTVAAAPGEPTPSGIVLLTVDGGAPIPATLGPDGSATISVPAPDAGDHTLFASYAAQGNYAGSAAAGTLHVDPAPLMVTVDNVQKVYGPNSVSYSIHVTGVLGNDQVLSGADSEGAEAEAVVGTYDIIVGLSPVGDTKLSNYAIQVIPGVVSVTPAPLTVTAAPNSKTYGGVATETGTIVGLVNNDNITASFASIGDAASASAGTYAITDTLSDPDGKLANYTLTPKDAVLTVNKAPLTITANNAAMTYGGSLPTLSASYTGWVNSDNVGALTTTPTLSTVAASSHAGSYAITASGAVDPDYSISYVPGTLTIGQAPLTVTANNAAMTYGGSLPTLSASYTGWVNSDNVGALTTTPTLSTVAASSHAGSYAITASGAVDPDYSISYVPGTLTIGQAPLTVTANNAAMTYGGSLPTLSASYTGWVNSDNVGALTTTPTLSTVAASSHAGSYAITASGAVDPDYSISYVPGTLTIGQAPLTVTANNAAMTYGGSLPTLSASYTGWVNSDNVGALTTTPTLSTVAASSHAGSYAITASGAVDPDYSISYVPGTLTIGQAPLTVTANNAAMTYGGSLPTLSASYTGWVNSDNVGALTTTPTLSTVAASSHAGSYAITASGAVDPDYSISYVPGTLTIGQAPLTVTANNAAMTYGGSLPTLSASYTGWVNSDNVGALTTTPTLSTVAASSHAGSYAITASGAVDPDYSISYVPGTLTIGQAPLTVTANNAAMTYGGSLPTLSASYTGWVNSDNVGALTTTPTLSTVAASSHAGTYGITATGAVDPDYSISYVPGTLTIQKAPLLVSANSYARTYGDPNPAFAGSVSGVVNGDAITATYATTASSASAVGTYAIVPTLAGAKLANYTITSYNGTLTVNKATPTISGQTTGVTITFGTASTPLGGSIGYHGAFPSGSVTIRLTGAATGATVVVSASINPATGAFSANVPTGGLPADAYSVSYSYGGDSNFNPAVTVNGTLAVRYATSVLTDTSKAKQSGSTLPIKLQVDNAAGDHVGSSGLQLTAVGISSATAGGPTDVATPPGGSFAGNIFTFDPSTGTYQFNLKLVDGHGVGLASGTYTFWYRIGNDPTLHSLVFSVK